MEMKNLVTWMGTWETNVTNRIQEMGKTTSGTEEMTDTLVKKSTKYKKFMAQNIQEI